ncbi:hypothetical protein PGTUg99_000872 [Puccinia graminis f. sp. tritici]|uniref:Uncharacterized protein n=1 Tax=Puccinia graminis f. sp. tritici TaxID=56615 RepID=A0A5B0RX40_PUCGR|nr:hypothetical protein PGTUg99_000872 [Puccinia graminis f. sp. tritici]
MHKESAAPRLQARLTFGSSSLAPPPELPRLAQTGPAPSLPAPQITLIHKYGQSSAYPNQYNHYPICSTNRASKAQLGPRSATVNLAHNTLSSELDASAYVALPTLLKAPISSNSPRHLTPAQVLITRQEHNSLTRKAYPSSCHPTWRYRYCIFEKRSNISQCLISRPILILAGVHPSELFSLQNSRTDADHAFCFVQLLLEHQYVPLEFEFLHYIGIHPHLSTILLACYVLGLTSLFTTAKFYI